MATGRRRKRAALSATGWCVILICSGQCRLLRRLRCTEFAVVVSVSVGRGWPTLRSCEADTLLRVGRGRPHQRPSGQCLGPGSSLTLAHLHTISGNKCDMARPDAGLVCCLCRPLRPIDRRR